MINRGLEPGSPVTPMADPVRLRKELADVAKRGYAVDKGTAVEGFNAVAAAILDFSATPVAAIAVLAPSGRLPDRLMRAVGRRVSEIAAAIGDEMRANSAPPSKPRTRRATGDG